MSQLREYVDSMAWYVDDRELCSSEGVAFEWPITEKVLLEKFPSKFTTYSFCEELGQMIQNWAEMGVFNMEYHIRKQRSTAHWEYRFPGEENRNHIVADEMRNWTRLDGSERLTGSMRRILELPKIVNDSSYRRFLTRSGSTVSRATTPGVVSYQVCANFSSKFDVLNKTFWSLELEYTFRSPGSLHRAAEQP